MMLENEISHRFWKETTIAAVHVQNRALLRPHSTKTPFELWYGRKPNVKYFRVFGSKCFIKNKDQALGKFEDRADEGIFLGYSSKSKAYRVYNKRLQKVIESCDVKVVEEPNATKVSEHLKKFDEIEEEEEKNDQVVEDSENSGDEASPQVIRSKKKSNKENWTWQTQGSVKWVSFT